MVEPNPDQRVAWAVRTMRDEKSLSLWISVDSLMGFRNEAGAKDWHPAFLALLDHIIREAQKADTYGRDVTS
jgi:hypothetical protein